LSFRNASSDPGPALRVACDLDGTLADMPAALRRESQRIFGRNVDGHNRELWAHVARIEDFWCSVNEIEPGAVARLAQAATAHRWDVIFLSQRPSTSGSTAQVQTQRWLEAHGFVLPSVYIVNGSRGRIADALALDVVIDDRPANCLDVATESSARPLLVWRGRPEVAPDVTPRVGIDMVFSMAEAIERLESLRKPDAHGLFHRLRTAVGV
jgi:hypothetical protein